MPKKKHKPEEIVAKLRQADVLISQGQPCLGLPFRCDAEFIRASSHL